MRDVLTHGRQSERPGNDGPDCRSVVKRVLSEWNARLRGKKTADDKMIRQMFAELVWLFRRHRGPGELRYYMRQMTRRFMTIDQLSIDPRGEWSPRKAHHVLAIINPQAKEHGIFFDAIDVTRYGFAAPRVLLVAYCIEHEIAVAPDHACPECVRHVGHV